MTTTIATSKSCGPQLWHTAGAVVDGHYLFNKQKIHLIKGERMKGKYYIIDRSIYGSKGGSTIGNVGRVLFDVPCQGQCGQSNIPALSPLNSPSIVPTDLLHPKHRVKSWTANETLQAIRLVTARRGQWDHKNKV